MVLPQVHAIVLKTYTRDELKQIMAWRWNQNLDTLVADKAFTYQVAELLERADRTGNLVGRYAR